MPIGTTKFFKNHANSTSPKKITGKLAEKNRKINRAITESIFLPCNI